MTVNGLALQQSKYLYLGGKPLNYTDDPVGSNATAAQYFPYGQMQSGSTPTESQAFGSYVADESGLLYADQRYYYQNWGRFLTADRSNANVDPTSSISWNHYLYSNGDPINGSDPTGSFDEKRANGLDDPGSGETGGGDDGGLAGNDVETRFEDPYFYATGIGCSSPGMTYTGGSNGQCDVAVDPTFSGVFSGPNSVGSVLSGDGTFFGSDDGFLTLASGGVAIATGTALATGMAATEGLATLGDLTGTAVETEGSVAEGAASTWDTTLPQTGSDLNVATDVTTADFQAGLESSGYQIVKDGISTNGPFTVLSNGQTLYAIYTSTSTGAASVQVFNSLGQTLVKYRLGHP